MMTWGLDCHSPNNILLKGLGTHGILDSSPGPRVCIPNISAKYSALVLQL